MFFGLNSTEEVCPVDLRELKLGFRRASSFPHARAEQHARAFIDILEDQLALVAERYAADTVGSGRQGFAPDDKIIGNLYKQLITGSLGFGVHRKGSHAEHGRQDCY